MNNFKKTLIMVITISCISVNNVPIVFAEESETEIGKEQMIESLVENGYTADTAAALSDSDIEVVYDSICDGSLIDVDTCAMEVDSLAELENYLSYTKSELIGMGLSEEEIDETDEQIFDMLSLTDEQIKERYGMDDVQVKMLRKAADKGNEIRETGVGTGKDIDNRVSASGSITSYEMTFTQSVTSNSMKVPNYTVRLSYNWSGVYFLACFKDKIVSAWGGGLNIDNESGTANYYYVTIFNNFKSYKKNKKMSVDVVSEKGIDKGVKFTFPQTYGVGSNGCAYKTKIGSVSFTLSKTKLSGCKTSLISNYCHRIISPRSSKIKIYANGSYVSISIGKAWDTTTPKTYSLSY